MQEKPLISFLIASNRFSTNLRRTLISCFEQTYSDFELVLILNGPEINFIHESVLKWFPAEKRLRIFTTEFRSLSAALNLGIAYCRSDLIARIDDDDICLPDRLTLQYAYMLNNPDVDLVGGAYYLIDNEGNNVGGKDTVIGDQNIRRILPWKNPICHPTVMFKKQVVEGCGGYLGDLHAQDYDLWLRLSRSNTVRFDNMQEKVIAYRVNLEGPARKSRLAYASMASAQIKMFFIEKRYIWLAAFFLSVLKAIFIARNK